MDRKIIYDLKICKFCDKKFQNINIKTFANHVRWCDKNFTNGDKGKLSMKIAWKKNSFKRVEIDKECLVCKKIFKTIRTENFEGNQVIDKKEKKCCSRNCAIQIITAKNKDTKKSVECKICSNIIDVPLNSRKINICDSCKKSDPKKYVRFNTRKCGCCETLINNENKSGLCLKCLHKKRRDKLELKDQYYLDCQFKFNVFHFPEEFEIKLIEEFGTYRASTHGINLNGISRDHIFSVHEGFKQGIDPRIISHPANCKLMKHAENFKKHTKCEITAEELKIKIKEWDKKYPPNTIIAQGLEQTLDMRKVGGSNPSNRTSMINKKIKTFKALFHCSC